MRTRTFPIRVTRRTKTTVRDRHGNLVAAPDIVEDVPVWVIAPRTRDEPRTQDRPEAVSTVWDIYAPPGTHVSATDQVTLPTGEVCEVVGEIGVWEHNPHTSLRRREGVQFTVQRREG